MYIETTGHYFKTDPKYLRPTEVNYLCADPTLIRKELGWEPKIRFKELVRIMIDADLAKQGQPFPGEGKQLIEKHFGLWHTWENQLLSMD